MPGRALARRGIKNQTPRRATRPGKATWATRAAVSRTGGPEPIRALE